MDPDDASGGRFDDQGCGRLVPEHPIDAHPRCRNAREIATPIGVRASGDGHGASAASRAKGNGPTMNDPFGCRCWALPRQVMTESFRRIDDVVRQQKKGPPKEPFFLLRTSLDQKRWV
jgi:hypothetical protein